MFFFLKGKTEGSNQQLIEDVANKLLVVFFFKIKNISKLNFTFGSVPKKNCSHLQRNYFEKLKALKRFVQGVTVLRFL